MAGTSGHYLCILSPCPSGQLKLIYTITERCSAQEWVLQNLIYLGLEIVQHSFCHILLVKRSPQHSPDSKVEKSGQPLDGIRCKQLVASFSVYTNIKILYTLIFKKTPTSFKDNKNKKKLPNNCDNFLNASARHSTFYITHSIAFSPNERDKQLANYSLLTKSSLLPAPALVQPMS